MKTYGNKTHQVSNLRLKKTLRTRLSEKSAKKKRQRKFLSGWIYEYLRVACMLP